jgi:O-antigen ligase
MAGAAPADHPGSQIPASLVLGAVMLTAGLATVAAFVVAQGGLLLQGAAIGAIGVAVAVAAVRQRRLLVLLVVVLGIQALFHKALGPLDVNVASGAPGFFISSTDLLLLALYGAWLMEGTLVRDLRAGLARPVFWVPLAALITVLPSLLVAQSLTHAMAELFRMVCMLGLFIYVGLRTRERRDIVVLFVGFALLAFIQTGIAGLQSKTGTTLGVAVIAQSDELIARNFDIGESPRPSGSTGHPVFFAALMAQIGLLGLALALGSRHRVRYVALAAAAASLVAIILAQSRAALVASLVVSGLVYLWYVRRGQLSGKAILLTVAMIGLGALLFRGYLADRIAANFGTDHFELEVASRMELNHVALAVIEDAPVFGHGLNNYEQVLHRYDVYGMIFADNPVHNLYLLVLAETGVLGLLGMAVTFVVLVATALRLAGANDPLLASLGVGAVAIYAFFAIEELSVFSLRQEIPLLAFWIISGLVAAGVQMAENDRSSVAASGAAA